ncbi:hypothetical protein SAMN05192553_101747 [Cyclobacterium xiamenense]|uniref:Uncharacterized protein n=1 Tax=Cyclobacterium xiamenense TaxID=1297121 RepID=A0A1H6UG66_9BACT|nr:hypothetical protein SAMN05192553_101747 [Cyclobacterium xiamenense]
MKCGMEHNTHPGEVLIVEVIGPGVSIENTDWLMRYPEQKEGTGSVPLYNAGFISKGWRGIISI